MQGRMFGAAVLAALVAAAPATAAKRVRWETRTIAVHTEYRMPPATMDGPCTDGTHPPGCLALHGTETMTGTFAATGTYNAYVYPHPSKPGELGYDGPNYMTGRIEGCGSGEFTYTDADGTLSSSQSDPFTQSMPGENTWTIVPTNDHDELARRLISGSGAQNWRSYPFNQDPEQENWGRGSIDGTVVCRVPVRGSRRGA